MVWQVGTIAGLILSIGRRRQIAPPLLWASNVQDWSRIRPATRKSVPSDRMML